MKAGDLDADGDLDLVMMLTPQARIFRNDGTGTFQFATNHSTISSASRPQLGDLDGDGDLDVAVEGTASQFAILLNTGTGSFGTSVTYTSGGRLALADFDGDGDLDIAASPDGANTVNLLANAGNGTFSAQGAVSATTVHHLFAGDLDGDGDNDVAEATSTGSVIVFSNLGSWSFTGSLPFPAGATGGDFGGADVDGDGDIDLAVDDEVNFSLIKNQGNGFFDPPVQIPEGANPSPSSSRTWMRTAGSTRCRPASMATWSPSSRAAPTGTSRAPAATA